MSVDGTTVVDDIDTQARELLKMAGLGKSAGQKPPDAPPPQLKQMQVPNTPVTPTPPATPPPPVTPPPAVPPAVDPVTDMFIPPEPAQAKAQTPPPPATPPPPVDPDAEMKKIDTSRWPEGQRQAFERYKQREAEANAKLKEVQTELEKIKATATQGQQQTQVDPEVQKKVQEYDVLKQQLQEAQSTLAQMDIQQDPQFKAKWDIPRAQKLKAVRDYLKAYDHDQNMAEQLEGMTKKNRLEKIRTELPDLAPALLPLLNDLDEIREGRSEDVKNAATNMKTFMQQREEQAKVFRAKTLTLAVDSLVKEGHFILAPVQPSDAMPVEKATKVNQFGALLRTEIQQVAESQDHALVASTLAAGVLARRAYLPAIKGLQEEVTKLRSTIASLRGASHTPGAGDATSQNTPSTKPVKGGSIATDALRRAAAELGVPAPI